MKIQMCVNCTEKGIKNHINQSINQICSSCSFDPDKVKTTTKMSSLMKLRIIDYKLCVFEYGLWPTCLAGCSLWLEIMYCCVYCSGLFVLFLSVMYIWVVSSTRRSGTSDLLSNLGQAKPSQAKPWAACKGVPSQHQQQKTMFDHSIMGIRPRWTSFQQHHRHHSCSSMLCRAIIWMTTDE